jgi:hypothetical protein
MKMPCALICFVLSGVASVGWMAPGARRQANAITPSPSAAKVHNRQVSPLSEGSRTGLQFDERQGDGLAWWPDVTLADGVIEFDVRGKDVLQQSFVGVAFHGVDEKTFEGVYFRPFNFKSADAARRAHGVQYISHPTFPWDKLRAERPNQFEREVSPPPDPNGWFHARVVIKHPDVQVFVNDAQAPALAVKQLSDRTTGWVGLWVGNGSGGSFANLKVSAAR